MYDLRPVSIILAPLRFVHPVCNCGRHSFHSRWQQRQSARHSLRRSARRAATQAWQIVPQPQSSLVLARDGQLIGELGAQFRVSVPIRTLPPYVGQAFIAVEDQRFYKHDGVDVVGMAAALKDAFRGHARGASTITQQLVGNMHPDLIDRADRSIARKIHEQNAAREMERHYDKEQILEAYLNQIHFGHGWYGIEEAARHYFGIPAVRSSRSRRPRRSRRCPRGRRSTIP